MNNKEILICVKCKKIICEFENEYKAKKNFENDNFIQCPYCHFIMGNPYIQINQSRLKKWKI